jgi:GTPase SAR1 family protein
MQRNEFEQCLGELSGIGARYRETAPEVFAKVSELPGQMAGFTVCVPVIGMFSAGKSSLLNAWLGHKLLPEDQGATTALATEIRYGADTSMQIALADGSRREVPHLPQNAEDANAPLASEGEYAICTTSAERLRQLRGVVPVDMPGTDSGIERHTKALYRYAHKGVAYLLVLDAGTGTLPASLTAFLSELNLEGKPVLVALHKSDKYLKEDVAKVEAEVRRQCRSLAYPDPVVIHTSSRDPETPERLHGCLARLDADRLCVSSFAPTAANLSERLAQHVTELRDSSTLDTAAITKKLQELLEAEREIEATFKREERRLSQDLRSRTLENVVSDVGNELSRNLDDLCALAERGDESALNTRITGIVNRVFSESIQRNTKANLEVFLGKMEETISISAADLVKTLHASAKGVGALMEGICKFTEKSGNLYKLASTILAVTTNIVMPVVELLVIFLPDIFSFFMGDREGQKRNQIREKLSGEIIPKIKSQVREDLKQKLPDMEKEILENIRAEWQGRMMETQAALEACRREKETEESGWKEAQARFSGDLKALEALRERFANG